MSKRKRMRLRGLAFFAAGIYFLALTCAGSATAAKPPSVLPVIVLRGSNYNMGYQYYQQVSRLFGSSILKGMRVPGGFTNQQLLALKANQWYIQKYTPEYIDMFKGMAAAATDAGVPLSYAEVLANYVGTTAYLRHRTRRSAVRVHWLRVHSLGSLGQDDNGRQSPHRPGDGSPVGRLRRQQLRGHRRIPRDWQRLHQRDAAR